MAAFYFPPKIAGGYSLQPPAIKHDLCDDGEYAEMESWARCRNCGPKTVSCYLVQKPTNSVAESAAAAAMQRLGPGNKSEGVAAEERGGRYWVRIGHT